MPQLPKRSGTLFWFLFFFFFLKLYIVEGLVVIFFMIQGPPEPPYRSASTRDVRQTVDLY